jgi:hypothetical protein
MRIAPRDSGEKISPMSNANIPAAEQPIAKPNTSAVSKVVIISRVLVSKWVGLTQLNRE